MTKKQTTTATNNGVIHLTVHEAFQMLQTIRSMLDMVVIVDPKDGMIWDIDENEKLYPVEPCYHMWGKESRCEVCEPLRCLESGEVSSTFERSGDKVFHVFSRPVMIDDRPFAFVINRRLDDGTEQQQRKNLADEQFKNQEIIKILASEYTSVYYIDLRTGELTPYSMNEETETTFGSVFRSGITYSEAYSLYVDTIRRFAQAYRTYANQYCRNLYFYSFA